MPQCQRAIHQLLHLAQETRTLVLRILPWGQRQLKLLELAVFELKLFQGFGNIDAACQNHACAIANLEPSAARLSKGREISYLQSAEAWRGQRKAVENQDNRPNSGQS